MKKRIFSAMALLLGVLTVLTSCGTKPNDETATLSPSAPSQERAIHVPTEPPVTTALPTETETEPQGDPLPEGLCGTWTLSWGTCTDFDGTLIESFTLDRNGILSFNGKSYPMEYTTGMLFYQEEFLRYKISLSSNRVSFDGERVSGGLRLSGRNLDTCQTIVYSQEEPNINSGRFYRNIRRVEITLDNWQEYFKQTDYFYPLKDPLGDISSIQRLTLLEVKDMEHVEDIIDGVAELTYQYGPVGRIHFNTETGEYYFTEATERELAACSRFINRGKNDIWPVKERIRFYLDEKKQKKIAMSFFNRESFYIGEDDWMYSGRLDWDGKVASALIFTTSEILEINRIEGTLLISE
ncbi:MAG: hypothetical protein IKY02_00120 [Lachnospiraceae bacterium]|nr:hypothetical protein [Lachnospiraceae bacterium]